MRRLATQILVVVGVFVLVVAGVLISRTRTVRVESLGSGSSKADFRIKEVQLEEESGGVRWQLKAEQALVFESEGHTRLSKIDLKVKERTRSWAVVGEEGDLERDTKNLEVRRNVVLTSDDGLRLETTVLRWHGGERRLWTDAPVRIERSGVVIEGTALDVKMAEEATAVGGRVHAVFDGGPREPRK
jgi:LPS export ABC transporter protein LptC